MTLGDIYDFFVQQGIKTDLRSRKQIQKKLQSKRKEYKRLKAVQRKFFDKDSLTNPYADARILYGNRHQEVGRILVGIDIEVGELLLADELSKRGQKVDLVIAHHPEGVALAGLDDVMDLQTDVLINRGIDRDVAKALMDIRIQEVARSLHKSNYTRTVDAARLLDIPLMCCHTPSDNHVAHYLQKRMDEKKPRTLNTIIDLLLKEPEYQDATAHKVGPRILVGKSTDKAGEVFVDMTGGTEGSKDIFARLSQCGVKTLLGMHLSEAHYRKVKSEYMNVVIAGHIASDNLGMNLLLDKLVKKKNIDIIECSGFRRIQR